MLLIHIVKLTFKKVKSDKNVFSFLMTKSDSNETIDKINIVICYLRKRNILIILEKRNK